METVELADNSPLEEADRCGSPSLLPTYHLLLSRCYICPALGTCPVFCLHGCSGPKPDALCKERPQHCYACA